MDPDRQATLERKLERLEQFIADLGAYAELDYPERRREHYAIERLIQLLCEASADISLQLLRANGFRSASSYRDIFVELRDRLALPENLADALMDGCAMRNVLTHLYDTIDRQRVVEAVDVAMRIYPEFAAWCRQQVGTTNEVRPPPQRGR